MGSKWFIFAIIFHIFKSQRLFALRLLT